MGQLQQGQAFALKNALENIDFRNAITVYFAEQVEDAQTRAVAALNRNPCAIEEAIKWSAKAEAALQGLNNLEEFTRQQLSRI